MPSFRVDSTAADNAEPPAAAVTGRAKHRLKIGTEGTRRSRARPGPFRGVFLCHVQGCRLMYLSTVEDQLSRSKVSLLATAVSRSVIFGLGYL